MTRSKHITMLFWTGFACLAGSVQASAPAEAVMLEIIGGDTAFRVDVARNQAWWIVGECQRPIPMENTNARKSSKTSSTKQTNQSQSLLSKVISNDVRLGSRQIDLQQQFRFNLARTPVTVDVYNSVRGGWSPVPVRVNSTCATDATCRRLAELPEC